MNERRLAFVLLLSALGPLAGAHAAPLDHRIAAFTKASAPQESEVTSILQAGIEAGRSSEALAAVQPWLNRNPLRTPAALFAAGRAAEFSGQWVEAVGFYQRLLQTSEIDPKLAGPATDATYRLLLNSLGDQEAAYLFMVKDGIRLREFGNARRHDRWFCDQARQRRDLVALSDRLAAIAQDRSIKQAGFADDFEWLCAQLEKLQPEPSPVYDAALRLADTKGTPPVTAARLRWVSTVMPYNQKLDALRDANTPAAPALTDAPLAAAEQLLKLDPDRATTIAAGWGVEYDHQHSGNCAKRFSIEGDRKLAQLLAAVPRMSPGKRDDLLAYRLAGGRAKFDVAAVRELVIKYPDTVESLTVADIPLYEKGQTTVEDARKLAPLLGRNPNGHAALIRAIAASGSLEFGPIVDALFKSEAWRFDAPKPILDLAWNAAATQDRPYKELAGQYAKLGERHAELSRQVAKNADTQQRLAAFDALYKDLLSKAPTIPGALTLWDELFSKAPNDDAVEMLKTLTANTSGDREYLLQRAVEKVTFRGNGRMPWQPSVQHNQFVYHREPARKAAGPLIAHLQGLLQNQMKSGEISSTLFGMWLHTVDTSDAKARSFIKALSESPAYAKLPVAYRNAAADSQHFGAIAIAAGEGRNDSSFVSEPLVSLPPGANAKQVEDALDAAIKRAAAAPQPLAILGVKRVADLPTWSDKTLNHVLSLFTDYAPIGAYPSQQGYEQLVQRLTGELGKQKRWAVIEPAIAGLWNAAATPDDPRAYRGADALTQFAEAAMNDGARAVALSVARSGSTGHAGRDMAKRPEPGAALVLGRLRQVAGKASIELGIIDIPVDRRDPAYPIFKSQADFALGNLDSAWELYEANADQLTPVVRRLTVPYCLWVLERNIETRRSERAEALIRVLTVWSREAAGTFTQQQQAELMIAYADAAFQQGALQTAKAWYRRVADAQEYRGTPLQYEAMLRSVDVDRTAKDFDSALAELDKLMRVRDEELRLRVHFARAEVLFAKENYADTFTELTTVLKRDPSHADALILMGKVQLQMRNLIDASEVELGISRDQKLIVPGEVLKVNLNDPALNISGIGADIEVEIWTKSGDRERVTLYQVGDDKTKFRAEVPTALGARVAGDKTLQLLGSDEVRYGFSERFRQKMTDLPPDPDVVIGVASDAHLAMSAGAFPPREGERKLDLEELGGSTAQQALGTRRVRPGNPVYVRVSDPDRSRTDQPDQVVVSAQTTSGDSIPRLVMTETGPYTGQFELAIPTARAQALAYASESAPGRDANMVISDQDYPGWSGEVGSKADVRYFTIDLNDNVDLGSMSIHCPDTDHAPTRFVLQTSLNGRDWETRARFPGDTPSWDGRPLITAFATFGRNILDVEKAEGLVPPDDWRHKMEIASARSDVAYGAFVVPGISKLDLDLPSGGHPGYSVLMRYRALFYQPTAAVRTFRLADFGGAQTLFLIDGKPADAGADDRLTITRELSPGLHEIEIWSHESRAELVKRKPKLLSNVDGQDELQACPDAMFDPASFPPAAQQTIPGLTQIKTVDGAKDQINVTFGQQTRARLVRLAIVDHKGASPAIKKITLSDRAGTRRLPVAADYQKLRANDQLEVVPGDQITLRYEDDSVVTDRRKIQQTGLSVAYNDATITASYLNYVTTEQGRELVFEPIRRFKTDDAIGIVVTDPDMDQTPEPDQLTLTVQAGSGPSATITALETGPHTGVFLGRVFPVGGAPGRDAEVQIVPGDTLTARYRDEENLSPGIPSDRSVVIEHAQYRVPALAVYDVSSTPLPPPQQQADKPDDDERGPEIIEPRRALVYQYAQPTPGDAKPTRAIIGATLHYDLIASHLAFAASSEIVAYVQTESGRKAPRQGAAPAGGAPCDLTVPGTLKLVAKPSRSVPAEAPAGYVIGTSPTPPSSRPALDEGRFAFSIPIVLGDVPSRSFATQDAEVLQASQVPDALAVRPGDKIYIGFAYLDENGKAQWLTATVGVESDAFLDVMNSRYRQDLTAAHVGESLYLRVIGPNLDVSPDRDSASVDLTTASGTRVPYVLRETEPHSGVFKGSFSLSYADQPAGAELPPVALNGLPVKYGDNVTVSLAGTGPNAPPPAMVAVMKGADGFIEPFSKRYGDDSVAIGTTFTLAECFFELAKTHREMEQESLARREMQHAQKLLSEALASHDDQSMQAHAEYLLGNLAQEYADLSKNDADRKQMYQDALARFSKIPLDYPDTEFAPKAQFKKALVYEKLGEVDIAVEEYVKLAYKYPKHELIPSAMSRLGAYFQDQAKAYKDKAEELEKQEGNDEAKGEALRLRGLATKEYLNAARVFGKLEERFPSDPLAPFAGLRSAMNYMRAEEFETAINGFAAVVEHEEYDGKEIRSQSLFWTGICYEKTADANPKANRMRKAFETYTRITFDFPDSIWAKQARGRLADPAFARIIEIEKQERERMLEGLKEQNKRK